MTKVLIVEDVPEMAEMLRALLKPSELLELSGLARNGWEARLEIERNRPDVVLLDEMLPGESSADLISEFLTVGIPVVLMTGVEDPHHPLTSGAYERLIKPDWKALEQALPRFEKALLGALSGQDS